MTPVLIETADNSHSLYLPEMDETYHSQNGAIEEALHVYVQAGLEVVMQHKTSINLFEFGFGTGLNALLSLLKAEEKNIRLTYETVEKYPLQPALYNLLNYGKLSGGKVFFNKLHEAHWDEIESISPHFTLHKMQGDVSNLILPISHYDLVYYDAFGPSKQAEVWEMPILENICKSLNKGGVLVTYSSQGKFRRNLRNLGFEIEKIPGPKGKREMTRATKIS